MSCPSVDSSNRNSGRLFRRWALGLAALAACTLLLPPDAEALRRLGRKKSKPSPWHLSGEALTSFPIEIGGRVSVELPLRIRLSTTFGYLPPSYVDAVNGIFVAAGAYDEADGRVVTRALDDSFTFRGQVGWRPFSEWGFYFESGYALVQLSASIPAAELLLAASGDVDIDNGIAASGVTTFSLDSTLHMLSLELGYEWILGEFWVIRTALGMVITLGAGSEMGWEGRRADRAAAEAVASAYADWFDDLYRAAVHVPYISVGLGLRLF